MDANTIIAISSIVTPVTVMVATIVVAREQRRTSSNVNLGNLVTNDVHDAVQMINGQTMAEAIQQSQDRDIATDLRREQEQ